MSYYHFRLHKLQLAYLRAVIFVTLVDIRCRSEVSSYHVKADTVSRLMQSLDIRQYRLISLYAYLIYTKQLGHDVGLGIHNLYRHSVGSCLEDNEEHYLEFRLLYAAVKMQQRDLLRHSLRTLPNYRASDLGLVLSALVITITP